MLTKLLISAGLRSSCCGAPIITWSADKSYCAKCELFIGSPKQQERKLVTIRTNRVPSLDNIIRRKAPATIATSPRKHR
ncbi:MAG TPA: hypothetical protein VF572_04760 [Candidatus Saccharimonadales bacterium]|jgi:hypothetical protein